MFRKIITFVLVALVTGSIWSVREYGNTLGSLNYIDDEWESIALMMSEFQDYPEDTGFEPIKRENYYSYSKLTDKQKEIYNEMVKHAEIMSTESNIFDNADEIDVSIAFSAMITDYPQFFWVGNKCTYMTNGNKAGFTFEETYIICDTIEERDKINKEINEKISIFLQEKVTPQMDEYRLELIIHDYICENMEYNKKAAEKDDVTEEEMINWNILGFFNQGSGVCESYAKIFQLLLYNVGIECTHVSGETDESHMWNAVKVDDEWSYVDVTWDDGEVAELDYNHANFNMNDKVLKLKHELFSNNINEVTDERIKKGQFNFFNEKVTNNNYYYVKEGLVVNSSNFIKVVTNKLNRKYDGKGVSTVEFCLLNSSVSVKTIDDMIGDYDIFNDLEGGFIKVNAYLLSSGNAFVLEARKSG